MLRITKLTDYGIVLLARIAQEPDEAAHSARGLAEEASLPLPMATKILKALARAGILQSHRGSRGGYVLARPASAISVGEIVAALEGPIAITECLDHGAGAPETAHCGIERLCPVRGNWGRINEAIREALGNISLAEMARPIDFRAATARLTQEARTV